MGPPPTSYLKNAMKYFSSMFTNVYFVICTNDLRWTIANLAGDNVVFSNKLMQASTWPYCHHVITS